MALSFINFYVKEHLPAISFKIRISTDSTIYQLITTDRDMNNIRQLSYSKYTSTLHKRSGMK